MSDMALQSVATPTPAPYSDQRMVSRISRTNRINNGIGTLDQCRDSVVVHRNYGDSRLPLLISHAQIGCNYHREIR